MSAGFLLSDRYDDGRTFRLLDAVVISPSNKRSSVRRASQSSPKDDDMNTKTHKAGNHHETAAEHHENAAHHHREAAKHYDSGDHEKAGHHAHVAHAHGLHATLNAHEAAKHHAEQYK
jgi:hypothetical protein